MTQDPKRRALISVSDKKGLIPFATRLIEFGFEIFSTGGTLKTLQAEKISARSVSELTHFPEILDGRVKTLHPAIFSGLLARRDRSEHLAALREHGLLTIDLVAVNLYPFGEVCARPNAALEEIVENIDIGGPSLLRAAAKNFPHVVVIVNPDDYEKVADEFARSGDVSLATRKRLAQSVFDHTSGYDRAIRKFMESDARFRGDEAAASDKKDSAFPETLSLQFPKHLDLRYGENPHQRAAFYRDPQCDETSIASAEQLHGKELSYNNLLDAEAALEMARDFEEPVAVIVKHSNPCGLAIGDNLVDAYKAALECDPLSAFGGIVAVNRPIEEPLAALLSELFLEVVIAPDFDESALKILKKKKNIRLLRTGNFTPRTPQSVMRSLIGGMLVQDRDLGTLKPADLKIVTKAQPNDGDLRGMLFAWKVVKWLKSN
ncbi:MAG: bifunctional phosphoribosylaminoimidazolecarboxamide formyltransferase/IMP cyclohydrolase, partial [bacterium]